MSNQFLPIRRLWIVLGVIALALLWIGFGYNGLVTEKEKVNNAWRQVETQYQRRVDLVPNLVRTVQGASNFEKSTLTDITKARTDWLAASGNRTKQVAAAENLDGALSRLLVSVEAYPQLQATQAFRDLMTQLEGTENRIATARKDYNDAVLSYNLSVKRFPRNVIAGFFGFAEEAGYHAVSGSENAPSVNFMQ